MLSQFFLLSHSRNGLYLNKHKKPPIYHFLREKQWTTQEAEDLPWSQNGLVAKPDLQLTHQDLEFPHPEKTLSLGAACT